MNPRPPQQRLSSVPRRATNVLVLLLCALPALAAAQAGFSPTERRMLTRGELVERPSPVDRGGHRYVGGTSYRVVDRSVDEVWRALHDFDSYEHMLPSTNETTVVEGGRTHAVVRVGHVYGPVSARYHLAVSFDDREHRLEFELDGTRPNDIEAAHGFCEVTAYEGGRSLVTWAGRVDPGSSFVIEPMRPEIQRWLLRVPSTMRSYLVDGAGRDRYREE